MIYLFKCQQILTGLNAKITEIESKIPSITGLATNSALASVENKIPDVIGLVKKTDYKQKVLTWKGRLVIIIMTNSSTGFYCNISTTNFGNKDRF